MAFKPIKSSTKTALWKFPPNSRQVGALSVSDPLVNLPTEYGFGNVNEPSVKN